MQNLKHPSQRLTFSDVLQPAAETDEGDEHGGGLKEGPGAALHAHRHGADEYAHRVGVGDASGQHHQHVHVSRLVLYGLVGLDVEVPRADELQPNMVIQRISHIWPYDEHHHLWS